MHDKLSEQSDKELVDSFKRAHALPPDKKKGMYIRILGRELEEGFGGN